MNTDRSHRFIHTKQVDESGVWYALDNAGIIMPAVTDEVSTGLFRLEVILKEPVDTELLGKALAQTASRFPYFNVTLRRGFFWYYFEECSSSPTIYPDDNHPCQNWNINKPGTRMFRIRVNGSTIAGEFSHALADGAGSLSFMKSLVVRYFILKGVNPGAPLGAGEFADIFDVETPPDRGEYEDGYQKYFNGPLPSPEPNPNAWHMKGPMLPKGRYRILTGTLEIKEILAEAKKRGVTLTEFLGAVYLDALQDIWFALPKRPRHHFISVEIPVNLRQFYPTKSNRNFSLFILLRENLHLGRRSFDELVTRAHHQMKLENDPKSIARQIARNAGGVRNFAVRVVPLAVKDIFARILFVKLGETMLSGFISNLGAVKLPPGIVPYIQSLCFSPAPSKTTLTNASAVTWKDELVISFGSLGRSRELEKYFFRRLRSLGLRVVVRCRDDRE